MPSDFALKAMNTVHRVVRTVTFGKVGNTLLGMPVVELTTTGRQSGQPRAVMLTAPVVEGDTLVLVASRGRDDTHPAWFLNLRDQPDVQVAVEGGPAKPYRAEIADAETRARLWPKITADHDNYAGYQTKTDREIPVVLLHPAG